MKEKLYTIPVNEAFEKDCECPICSMYQILETEAIEFTMGPSYMEDDIREMTSKQGFCEKHLSHLYKHQNRLGLALILQTHMDKTIRDVEKLGAKTKMTTASLFKKKGEVTNSALVNYLDELESSCFVCNKIEANFIRYIATLFHLYHYEESFRQKFISSKGFCSNHFKLLLKEAPNYLNGDELNQFNKELNQLYIDNMKRVSEDLEWFIKKFDYRFADEPWKNSKDALTRAMLKTDSLNS